MTKKAGERSFAAPRDGLRGFTLTELAVVLGIVGIILGAIWAATGMVYENNRTRLATSEMLTIVNNWKSIYGNKRIDIADGNDMTQMTVNNGFAPQEMVPPAGQANGCIVGQSAGSCDINGPWGGNIVQVKSGANTNSVQVRFLGLTQTECNNLGNSIANASGLVAATLNGTAKSFPPIGTDTPLLTSDVSGACATAGSGNFVYANFSLN
jgi:prepilin-type N-terminal cleavage/methylation domain-containing protein